jgi:membrane protein implicated in regulation of membrane protease activity
VCHVLLVLPLLALPVFWLLPPGFAVPIYAVVLLLSGGTYAAALKAMHKPVVTGKDAIVHGEGVVERSVDGVLSVRILGERWAARAEGQELVPGNHVTVVGMDGLTLCVKRKG